MIIAVWCRSQRASIYARLLGAGAAARRRRYLAGAAVGGALAANRTALRTALAIAAQLRPQLHWLDGRIVWLGEDVAWSPDAAHPTPRAKDVFGPACLPWEVRPYSATTLAQTPVTCIIGSISCLLQSFAEVKKAAQRDRIQDVWPQLAVVFYSRRLTDPDASALRAELGEGVLCWNSGISARRHHRDRRSALWATAAAAGAWRLFRVHSSGRSERTHSRAAGS